MRNKLLATALTAIAATCLAAPAHACSTRGAAAVTKALKQERSTKRKVSGEFVVLSRREFTGPYEKAEYVEIFGQVTSSRTGRIFLTRHITDNLLFLCGRAMGPFGNAKGDFYLNRQKSDGHYALYDWDWDRDRDGDYHSELAKEQ